MNSCVIVSPFINFSSFLKSSNTQDMTSAVRHNLCTASGSVQVGIFLATPEQEIEEMLELQMKDVWPKYSSAYMKRKPMWYAA